MKNPSELKKKKNVISFKPKEGSSDYVRMCFQAFLLYLWKPILLTNITGCKLFNKHKTIAHQTLK